MVNVRAENILNQVEKFRDWEQFQSTGSELISPVIYIDFGEDADKARDFTASVALAYKLSKSKLAASYLNNSVPKFK
jgi:hypothetical protein